VANEKEKRVKYIRLLEKFANSAISALKKPEFDEELFGKLIAKNIKILENCEPVYLDNSYTKALENFVNLAISGAEKNELLKEANAMQKLKNLKFKKAKHKKSNFEDF